MSRGIPKCGLDRRMESCPGRLADKRGNSVRPGVLFPTEREPGRRQDNGRIRVDLPDVLDQDSSSLRIAARPDVVNEDVGTLGEVAWPLSENRTAVAGRSATLDQLITESTE